MQLILSILCFSMKAQSTTAKNCEPTPFVKVSDDGKRSRWVRRKGIGLNQCLPPSKEPHGVPSKERQTKHFGLARANTSIFLQHVLLSEIFCLHYLATLPDSHKQSQLSGCSETILQEDPIGLNMTLDYMFRGNSARCKSFCDFTTHNLQEPWRSQIFVKA